MREKYCVDIGNKEERKNFIEKLESNGYIVDETIFSRKDIICNKLPIIVEMNNKIISMMGNVTVVAAAVSSRVIIKKDEFEQLFKNRKDKSTML